MPDDRYYPVTLYQDDDNTPRYYEKTGDEKKKYAINQRHLFKLPRVFSIFCQGTGGHRYGHCKELITEFHSAYWDRGETPDEGETSDEYYTKHYCNTFLILDGPGRSDHQGPDGEDLGQMGLPHPMPGDFAGASLDKPMKESHPGSFSGGTRRDYTRRVSEMFIDSHTGYSSLSDGGRKHRGDVMGDGWNDNVAHALFVLNELLKKDQFPEVINLMGWSRGAVTTIKVANAIHKFFVDGERFKIPKKYEQGSQAEADFVDYPDLGDPYAQVDADALTVNIFAIDPVPGRFGKLGSWGGSSEKNEQFPTVAGDQDYRSLPSTVKKCIITLALDECRSGFAPICNGQLTVNDPSRVVWLPFPGIHRTQLRMEPRDPVDDDATKEQLKAVPHLVFDLAWRFMTSNGTAFKYNLLSEEKFGGGLLTLAQVVEKYSNVWLNRGNYHKTRNRSRILKLKWRKLTGYRTFGEPDNAHAVREDKLFTTALGAYVGYPGFFINVHHQACFEKAYPELYTFLTTTASTNVNKTEIRPADPVAQTPEERFIDLSKAEYANVRADLNRIIPTEEDQNSSLWQALAKIGFRCADGNFEVVVFSDGEECFVSGVGLADPGRPVFQLEEEVDASPPATEIIAQLGLLDYPEEWNEEEGEDVGAAGGAGETIDPDFIEN